MAPLTRQAPAALRRPLVGLALSWVTGLGASHLWPNLPPWGVLGVAAFAVVVAAWLAGRTAGAATWAAHIAVALTALSHGLLAQPGRRADDLARSLNGTPRYVELVVRISSAPARQSGDESDPAYWRWQGHAEAMRITETRWRSLSGQVDVWMPAAPGRPDPVYGDRWHVGGVARRGDDGRVRLSVREPVQLLGRNAGARWRAWCFRQRERAREALRRGIEDWTGPAEIIPAMMLGYRDEVPGDLRERFMRTGTAHVFAISGLHVGIFSVVLAAALRTLGVPRRWWGVALVPMLAVYTVATGASVSALRAFVIAAVWGLAPVVRRRPDLPSALAAAALLILGTAPAQIAEAGFWYSFLVVAGLVALTPPIERFTLTVIGGGESAQPPDSQPGWRAAARAIMGAGTRLMAASIAAWIASAPLTVYTGNQLSPAALPGNLIVIPASFLIVLTGCLSLVAGLISDWLAITLNHSNAAICAGLVRVVDALFSLPGSHFAVVAPPLWAVVLTYLAVAGWRIFEGRARTTLLVATALVTGAGVLRYATDREVKLVPAPPELAPAVLLDVPGERGDWLISPGPRWSADRLLRWLRSRGVDRLDAMLIPVLDAAHAGAAPLVLARVPTRRILVPAGRVVSPLLRRWLEDWRREGRQIVELAEGDEGVLAGDAVWDVWHPPRTASFARSAEAGLWLRVARGRLTILLAGTAVPTQVSSIERIPFDPIASVVLLERAASAEDQRWLNLLGTARVIEHVRAQGNPPASPLVLR